MARHELRLRAKTPPRPPRKLIDKKELRRRVPASFPTVWQWMRKGKFPRAHILHGKSVWFEDEIDAFLEGLPVRPYKGDPQDESNAK
jgi:predicted DNA-binding transcriptional regulator AlpA